MPPTLTKLLSWTVQGTGESIIGNGGSQAGTIPRDAEIVHLVAEGGVCYYQFGGIASTLSSGFVPENGRVIEGPLSNLDALSVFAAVGVTVHIQYYQRNRGH